VSLLPFLLVTGVGAALALLARPWERAATAIGVTALLLAVVTAAWIDPGEVLLVDGSGLATTEFLRLFLLLGAVCGVILAMIGAAAGTRRDATAVTLALLATSGLALALPDARLAVLAATAGGVVGSLLTITPSGGRLGATIGMRALRAAAVAGTMAIAATAWIGRDLSELAAQPVVFGLAYLAMAIAVAVRFGAIPLHAWAARLTDSVPEATLPLVTAWAPAAFAVVALAWADRSIAPLLVDVDAMRLVVLAIGAASILLAALAASIHDDIEHVVGYSIIGDAGVIILAVAVLDPAAWEPARTFILAFVVARSAFAAWAAAARSTLGTGRVDEMRGWVFRSPLLAIAFAAVVLASIGLPGLAAFEARATIVELAVDGPVAAILLLGTFLPLVYYGRLALVGLARQRGQRPAMAAGSRPILTPLDATATGAWLRTTWDANRAFTATLGALVLSLVAVGTAIGGFGGPAAAAGLPPTLEGVSETFEPIDPNATPEPQASEPPIEPSAGDPSDTLPDGPSAAPSLEPSVGPSFEPVPTG
jgi:formate hydrogenlyase subunit 3/multisubunit Na+/H+ antiporter MnhD subunit